MAALLESLRLCEVARMVKLGRSGATLEEIVAAAKEGLVTEEQAIAALERDLQNKEAHRQNREIPCGDLIETEVGRHGLPETDTLYMEVENALLRVLNDLPPRQRQVVELYYFEGRTQDQIARRLSVSQPAIVARLEAARKSVAKMSTQGVIKAPPKAHKTEADLYPFLMRMAWRKYKRANHVFYPYQLWLHANVGGYWSGNGIYATRYVDKLPQYLADCFKHPPVIPRDV